MSLKFDMNALDKAAAEYLATKHFEEKQKLSKLANMIDTQECYASYVKSFVKTRNFTDVDSECVVREAGYISERSMDDWNLKNPNYEAYRITSSWYSVRMRTSTFQ
jgi:thymidine phosphorylase